MAAWGHVDRGWGDGLHGGRNGGGISPGIRHHRTATTAAGGRWKTGNA